MDLVRSEQQGVFPPFIWPGREGVEHSRGCLGHSTCQGSFVGGLEDIEWSFRADLYTSFEMTSS